MAQTVSSRFLIRALLCAAALTLPLVALSGRQGVGGRVVGRVIERDTGHPLAAELGLVIRDRRGIALKHVLASKQGEFEISDLPEGTAHLSTKLAGYAVEHASVDVHSSEASHVEFRLLEAKPVRGVVSEPAGHVLEGATVRVIYASGESEHDSVVATYQWEMGEAKTDERGDFALEVHPEKEFVIEATHPSYVGEISDPKRIDPASSSLSLRLSLGVGVRVTVEARNEYGELLPGAFVSLIEVEERPELRRFTSAEHLRQRTMQTVSDQNGRFRFDQVRPASKTLIITHPNHHPIRQTLDVTYARETQPRRVTLQRKLVQ